MQLKQKNPRRAGLAAATLSLLGAASPAAQAGDIAGLEGKTPWEFDTAVLLYSESDGRVQAVEPVLKLAKDLGNDRRITTKLVLDALTGASPNGATPASTPQTFARPSGTGTFTAAAGETPLDDTFRDTRVALSGDYQFPLSRDATLAYGLNFSTEYDFLSVGGNLKYTLDFNQGNTTFGAGLSFESDETDAEGGAPIALTPVPSSGPHSQETDTSKTVTDLVLGLSQVINPTSLVQFNYSLSVSSGYHSDPYKLLSVVDANGEPLRYVYEGRPDSRTKHALFGRYKRFLTGRDVLDASYRFMTDDWGVVSHTVDAGYRWNFSDHQYLEPHLRWYNQGAADFYHVALFDGTETTFASASADPRLGAFDGVTLGLKYGHTLRSGNQWSARLEYYQQTGRTEGVPDQAAAGLAKFNLEPELSALMLTFGYRFKW